MSIFDVRTTEEADGVRLALTGELDLATAPRVEEELEQAERARPGRIVLDLRGLTFIDSSGLRVIVAADARARAEGRRLTLVQGPEAVRRVFEITGLAGRLDIVDDDDPPLASTAG